MDVNSMTPGELKEHAYHFIEDGPDERHKKFIDFCYEHFRGQMRVMMLAFCDADGKMAFDDYLAEPESEV